MYKIKTLITGILSACMLCLPTINCYAETDTPTLYGDANCDNIVDIRDITALKKHLVGLQELSDKGIENCGFFNNTVNVKSLSQMTKYIIKDVDELQFSYYDDGIYEKYEPFSNYIGLETDDGQYSNNAINITIKHQYSIKRKEWTAEDLGFKPSQISEISEWYFLNISECQVLQITLSENNRENLTNIITNFDKEAIAGKFTPIKKISLHTLMPPVED